MNQYRNIKYFWKYYRLTNENKCSIISINKIKRKAISISNGIGVPTHEMTFQHTYTQILVQKGREFETQQKRCDITVENAMLYYYYIFYFNKSSKIKHFC